MPQSAQVWASRLASVASPADLTAALRLLKEDSGRAVQAIAQRGKIAAGTVQNVCDDRAGPPRWQSVEGFLIGCGVVDQDARGPWRAAFRRAYPSSNGGPPRSRPAVERLATLFSAQWDDAQFHRYHYLAGHAPALPSLYVDQQGESSSAGPGPAELFTVREMLQRSRHMLVIAPPGMGKSTMVNQIQYEQANWGLADGGEAPFGEIVPVGVPASLLVDRNLPEALDAVCDRLRCDRVRATGPPLPGFSWLIMVDGLDEVLTSFERQRVLTKLESWIRRDQAHLRFLVASRPLAVNELSGLRSLRTGEYRLRRFDDADLAAFARNWFGNRGETADLSTRFLAQVSAARLRPVVRVPLLATIAALVFDADPDRELPVSRAGLYSRFVADLREGRRDAPEHRRRLEAEFDRQGPAGRRAGVWLQDILPQLLEHLAETQLSGDRPILLDQATRWTARKASVDDIQLVAGWDGHLRALLTGTAVLVDRGRDLVFAHQSFAEYLAAGRRARQFDEAAWLSDVRSPERRNVALFVLALSIEAADRLVRLLLDNGGADVIAAGDILADGIEVDVPLRRRVVAALFGQVTAEDPTALDAVRVLTDLRPDPAVADRLGALVRDDSLGPWVRAVVADALAEADENDDHLRWLMADPALPGATLRWVALRFLRRYGPSAEADLLLTTHAAGDGTGDGAAGVFRRYAVREVSADTTAGSQDRLNAAIELARYGDPAAPIALSACVADLGLRLDLRLEAARSWLETGDGVRDALLEMATSASVGLEGRAVAATAIADIGDETGRRVLAELTEGRPALLDLLPAFRSALLLDSLLNADEDTRHPEVWGNLPPRNPRFAGREDLIRRLAQGSSPTALGRLRVLHGQGGVGKSQTAIEYVYRFASGYDLIWWIPAGRPGQIRTSLAELARILHLGADHEVDSAVPIVLDALSKGVPYRNWLLIFDNVADLETVRPYLPDSGPGEILLSTQGSGWGSQDDVIEVDVFTRDESVEFLLRRNPDLDELEAERLAEALGDLPLALESAGAWHASTGKPVDEYLELLAQARDNPTDVSDLPDHSETISSTLHLSLDRLGESTPVALQLLKIYALLASEPVPRDLLVSPLASSITPGLDETLADPIRFGRAMRDMQRFALVRIDHRSDTVEMHRLVKAVVLDRMSDDERQTMLLDAQRLLANADPRDPSRPEQWSRYQQLWPHAMETGAVRSPDEHVQELVYNLTQFLYYWGDHVGSGQLAAQSYAWRVEYYGESHPETLRMMKWLAWTHLINGRFAESRRLNSRALELLSESVGDRDEETIDAMRMVTNDLRISGDLRAARAMDERAFNSAREQFSGDDPQTLSCATGLAASLRLLAEFEQALELDLDTARRQIAVFGAGHASALRSHNNVITDIRELGRYREARRQQEDVYLRQVQNFGESNPDTLRTARSLAIVRRLVGEYPAAHQLSARTVEQLRRRYGDDHPETIITALTCAIDLRHAGDLGAARSLHETTLGRVEALFGDGHFYAYAARTGLAVVLLHLGDLEQARAHNEAAFDGLIRTLGPDHPMTLSCATNLANDLFAIRDFPGALELDADTVRRSREALGPHHPATLIRIGNLALLERGSHADRLLTATRQRLVKLLGRAHPAVTGLTRRRRADCDIDLPDL